MHPPVYHVMLNWAERTGGGRWPIVSPVELPGKTTAAAMIVLCYRIETDAKRLLAANLVAPYPDEQTEFDPITYRAELSEAGDATARFSRRPASKIEAAFLYFKMHSDAENVRMLTESQAAQVASAETPSGVGSLVTPSGEPVNA